LTIHMVVAVKDERLTNLGTVLPTSNPSESSTFNIKIIHLQPVGRCHARIARW